MERPNESLPSDRDLLERYRRGELAAFEAILDRYEKSLLRFAARYDPRGAQDLVQEVFLRLVREAPRLGVVQSLSAWLFRVARNLAIDSARKEMRMNRRQELAAAPEIQSEPETPAERGETLEIVTAKLLGLPPRQRDVLILKLQEEKSYREISDITGLTVANVGYLIHQGLKKLARELRAAGVV